jgi:hypothetical protein
MAKEVTIGGSGSLFVGEDKTFRLELLDAAGVPVNMAGWTIKMTVRVTDASADPALIEKTATVDGVYNAVRATNTQRAMVICTDVDLGAPLVSNTYRCAWKRYDEGNETVLAYGPCIIQGSASR